MQFSNQTFFAAVTAALVLLGVPSLALAQRDLESQDKKLWHDLYQSHGCEAADVLCLRGDGIPLPADEDSRTVDALPKNVTQGSAVTIKTIGCTARYEGVKFEIGLEVTKSGDRLFRADYTTAESGVDKSEELESGEAKTPCTEPEHFSVLNSTAVSIPSSAASVSITFKRQALEELPGLEARYSAKVIRGLYFLDIGFAAPFVIGGDRIITATRDPSVDLNRLTLEQDLLIRPAIMLNVFPGGRRLGALTSFARDRDCKGMPILDKRRCNGHNVGRGFANSLGLQLGLSLDTQNFGSHFYMGAMFEPVVGLNLGFGLALVRGQYYRDGFTDGHLIGADVVAAEYTREQMMPRPYFSVSFSLDIIRNVRAAMNNQEITSLRGNGG